MNYTDEIVRMTNEINAKLDSLEFNKKPIYTISNDSNINYTHYNTNLTTKNYNITYDIYNLPLRTLLFLKLLGINVDIKWKEYVKKKFK